MTRNKEHSRGATKYSPAQVGHTGAIGRGVLIGLVCHLCSEYMLMPLRRSAPESMIAADSSLLRRNGHRFSRLLRPWAYTVMFMCLIKHIEPRNPATILIA